MKKIISLSLSLLMLASFVLPMESFALTYSSDVKLNKTFSDFTTNNSPALGGTDANSVLLIGATYKFYGGGSVANFIPAKGLFGKASDDTSVEIIRTSDGNARMYGGGKLLPTGGLEAENNIIMNWNWAFGDKQSTRTARAEFYTASSLSYSTIKQFYSLSSGASSDILSLAPDGSVKLFNYELSNKLSYKLNTWYNFEVRIKNGNSTTSTYSMAELYVDGIKLGSSYITTASNHYQQYGIGWFYLDAPLGTTYVDDLQIGYFKSNAANDIFTEMHQSFELTSKSDAYITEDNIHLDLKYDMTVAEFLEDVSYNEKTADSSGISEVKILKADWSEADANSVIENGWYARVKVSGDWSSSLSRNVYRYYYRKFIITKRIEISDFTLTSSAPGETTYAQATLTNNTGSSFNTGVMLALYNDEGGLESIKRVNLNLSNGANSLSNELSLTLPAGFDSDYMVKLFVTPADDYTIIHEATLN